MSGMLPENLEISAQIRTCVQLPMATSHHTLLLYTSSADRGLLLLKECNLFSCPPRINHLYHSPEYRQLAFQGFHKEENRAQFKSRKILAILTSSDCPITLKWMHQSRTPGKCTQVPFGMLSSACQSPGWIPSQPDSVRGCVFSVDRRKQPDPVRQDLMAEGQVLPRQPCCDPHLEALYSLLQSASYLASNSYFLLPVGFPPVSASVTHGDQGQEARETALCEYSDT